MKLKYALLLPLSALVWNANAQSKTYKRDGYTLTFTNTDATLPASEQERIINTFFDVYPKLAKAYNKHTAKDVNILIDTAYKGVAETGDAHIRISSKWLHDRPEDIDVVTHEGMHIVQDYGETTGPGWLTEGIADYARSEFGINNAAANWKLPDYKAGQSYENSYRITARFLLWIEQHVKKGVVKELDKQMREHTYTADSWKKLTGKTLDELWQAYVASPALAANTK
ncbi:hypothetical protein GCM10027037_14230 [Mucilaginibacter koreensis]